MMILKQILCIIIGFGSGLVISCAVFAFITAVGVLPRIAQKTNTKQFIKYYEEVLLVGGVIGGISAFYDIYLPIGKIGVVIYSLGMGIFFGCLAASLAEVLNVIPILSRRARVQQGLFFFIMALAIGKLAGALMYFYIPGFYSL